MIPTRTSYTMWCQIILLCLLLAESMSYRTRRGEPLASSKSKSFDLLMPGALPLNDDSYLCSSFSVASVSLSSSIYVTEFLPNANAARAHHMLLYACEEPVRKPGVVYDCLHHQVCNSSSSIMFAWAKNAPPKKLPQDVSFEVSPDQKGYLVLQVHYKHPLATPDNTGLSLKYSTQATTYTAGILLMLRGYLTIPPNTESTHGDVNCQLPSSNPLHFFAYRTHAHSLGSVITGYVYNANKSSYHEIARGNPQWPQAFYPMKQVETVHPGEILAARCTYNTLGHNTTTRIGSTGGDEMCNLYLMFYAKPGDAPDNFIMCMNEQVGKAITDNLPEDSDTPLPSNPLLEEHSSNKDSKGNLYKLFQNELESGTSKKKVLEDPDSDSSFTEMFQQELDTGTSRKKVLEDPSGEGTDFSNGAQNQLQVEQKKSGAGPTVRKRPGVDMDQDDGSSNSPPPPPPPTTSAPIKTPVVTSSSPLETSVSKLKLSVPLPEMSGSMVIATTASLILSLLVICCLAIRKCRKKGKGTASSKNRGKQWDTGDILGRNKEGFQPLNTDDRDGDYDCDSDSEVEEFSVPAMHA